MGKFLASKGWWLQDLPFLLLLRLSQEEKEPFREWNIDDGSTGILASLWSLSRLQVGSF